MKTKIEIVVADGFFDLEDMINDIAEKMNIISASIYKNGDCYVAAILYEVRE